MFTVPFRKMLLVGGFVIGAVVCFVLGHKTADAAPPPCAKNCDCKVVSAWLNGIPVVVGAFAPGSEVAIPDSDNGIPHINSTGGCVDNGTLGNNGTYDQWQLAFSTRICNAAPPLEVSVGANQGGQVPGTKQGALLRNKCNAP